MVLAGAGRGAVGSVKARGAADGAVVALRAREREEGEGVGDANQLTQVVFPGDILVMSTKFEFGEEKRHR